MTPEDNIRPELEASLNKTIKKVGDDIEILKFNTAIASLMSLMNDISDTGSVTKAELRVFTILMSPFAPHVAEEVWSSAGLGEGFAASQSWPEYDESKCRDASVEIVVQVNGKVRDKISIAPDTDQQEAVAMAKASEKVQSFIQGKNIVKEIYVKGKLVNIVAK